MAENILLSIALLLFAAKVLGYASSRLGFSSLLGEMIAGILLGPVVLGLVVPDNSLKQIANFGILFFLFLVGLHSRQEDFRNGVYEASAIAIGGDLLSFVLGFAAGMIAFNSMPLAIFFGIALISSSTAMSIRNLSDARKMHTRGGRMLLPVALADDVIAILSIALLGTYISLGTVQLWQAVSIFLGIIGFFLLVFTFGSKVTKAILDISERLRDESMIITIALAMLFFIAYISEQIGVAAVTGAFLAGIAMSGSRQVERDIIPKASAIGHGFFVPLFFAYSTVELETSGIGSGMGLAALLLIAGATAKYYGCSTAAKFADMGKEDRRIIGLAMIPRGEYTIIVSQLALAAKFITPEVYTIAIGIVALSMLASPVVMKVFLSGR
ncbi:MAG: cation:proton antiporter [Candidatus Aenigmarchaeota archaeon]|nr:cation:proton antiporter [Candidatus Aenigmarchaeota archaeon]